MHAWLRWITAACCVAFCGGALAQFESPGIKLDPALARIFSVDRCQWISGLTCKITYNGKGPLPSRVFFTEFDAQGRAVGPRVTLIYPHLNPSERGAATFRITSASPASLRLTAQWGGAWHDLH